MMSDTTVVLWLIGQVITAAGVYAAIRADLQELKYRANEIERRLIKGGL